MATTEDRVRFNRETVTYSRPDAPPASDLEQALLVAAAQMRRERHGILGAHADLEALADMVIEKAMRDEHTFVLCSAKDPANPTAEEHRWAQSIAGAAASRFQRTARRVMRALRGEAPTAAVDATRDADGCPAWCHNHGIEHDWHESKPIAFEGPGDMYDETPEPLEVMWAALSEVPTDEVEAGGTPGPYIYFDTLSVGQGSRLNVAEADDLIRRLSHYVLRLKAMRDQLAVLTADQD